MNIEIEEQNFPGMIVNFKEARIKETWLLF